MVARKQNQVGFYQFQFKLQQFVMFHRYLGFQHVTSTVQGEFLKRFLISNCIVHSQESLTIAMKAGRGQIQIDSKVFASMSQFKVSS